MSTAVPLWTCPQCQRRVPGREPLCHCGFPRTEALAVGAAAAPRPPDGQARRWAMLGAALGACTVAMLLYVATPGERELAAAPHLRARFRGETGYPALPPIATAKARRSPRAASASETGAPPAPVPQGWARVRDLIDLPLRRIASDTSLLELSHRPFAEACLDPGMDAGDASWLESLKTGALRPGVTLRQDGATVDCETARRGLVARADALKVDLDATEKVAHANGVLPGQWRALLATYELDVWDGY